MESLQNQVPLPKPDFEILSVEHQKQPIYNNWNENKMDVNDLQSIPNFPPAAHQQSQHSDSLSHPFANSLDPQNLPDWYVSQGLHLAPGAYSNINQQWQQLAPSDSRVSNSLPPKVFIPSNSLPDNSKMPAEDLTLDGSKAQFFPAPIPTNGINITNGSVSALSTQPLEANHASSSEISPSEILAMTNNAIPPASRFRRARIRETVEQWSHNHLTSHDCRLKSVPSYVMDLYKKRDEFRVELKEALAKNLYCFACMGLNSQGLLPIAFKYISYRPAVSGSVPHEATFDESVGEVVAARRGTLLKELADQSTEGAAQFVGQREELLLPRHSVYFDPIKSLSLVQAQLNKISSLCDDTILDPDATIMRASAKSELQEQVDSQLKAYLDEPDSLSTTESVVTTTESALVPPTSPAASVLTRPDMETHCQLSGDTLKQVDLQMLAHMGRQIQTHTMPNKLVSSIPYGAMPSLGFRHTIHQPARTLFP
ncbi:hypothetical protein Ciccas_000954 [Cichlidogyrus casuarinus]|uniref:Uncharacterized protein n=1 Tax=Cichlidogyrus casuarinus TaxID=1844966 RepID=A0ABD2QLG2_9PLAT